MGLYRKLDDHYEVRIDQGRMALLGIGAALVLALVFLVGVVVGKSLWAPRAPLAVKTQAPPPVVDLDSCPEGYKGRFSKIAQKWGIRFALVAPICCGRDDPLRRRAVCREPGRSALPAG